MSDKMLKNSIYDAIEKTKPPISVLNKAHLEMDAIAASDAVAPKASRKFSLSKIATVVSCCLIMLVVGLCIPMFINESGQDDGGWTAGGGIQDTAVTNLGSAINKGKYLHFSYDGMLTLTRKTADSEKIYYLVEEVLCDIPLNVKKMVLTVEVAAGALTNQVEYDNLMDSTVVGGVPVAYGNKMIDPMPNGYGTGYYNYEALLTFTHGGNKYYAKILDEKAIDILAVITELMSSNKQ